MKRLIPVGIENVDITDGFWYERQKQNAEVTVYAVQERYEETGRFEAFKFNWREGTDILKPHFFWDSDVAKWMEGACYILLKKDDEALRQSVEELVDLIEKNQDENGYFNIFHTVVEPQNRFKIRDHHELYCFGHLMEASVAYQKAFHSDRMIRMMDRYADCVIKAFVTEKTAGFVTPGHEEIELALFKLYALTKNEKYRDLGLFFINERGVRKENDTNLEWSKINYNQSHLPVRQQYEAFGHAVRACYLYAGMADAAYVTGDEELFNACKHLFDDITRKKMYITGGVGSSNMGEAFTVPYDLPNATAYNETCAAIAMQLFTERLKNLELNSAYADITELEMYNGILSGISLDGTSFFYENPLEIRLSDRSRHTSVNATERLPITRRQKNFGCSCCPPNMVRFLASVGGNLYSYDDNAIYVHQFISSEATVNGSFLTLETEYPKNGKGKLNIAGAKGKTLYVRVPGWCKDYSFSKDFTVTNGYAALTIHSDDYTLTFDFVMKPRFVYANPKVQADLGKLALMYGPIVYCTEAQENGDYLFDLAVHKQTAELKAEITYDDNYNANTITVPAVLYADENDSALYSENPPAYKEVSLKYIPYFAFANARETDMCVWLHSI